ncbi:PREDICTED: GPN-loop GTPase 3 [Polistes dominula]|uniref:GPN-loop GTPase 3 n=1 Tax=Polistes dominula TaxID=743375 RepID=A0ABM1IJ12_POLDO|nr:PREDICTED: GPN-loop GTPase 3 [Polistes dominula]
MRYAQLVMGPAGSGKSTYCSIMQQSAADEMKTIEVVNLDPAAEHFDYEPFVDIRELIELDDAMEDEQLRYGPNGGLVFCMEYLIENSTWLEDKLDDVDGDYVIFDCPGQIELYTHMKVMRQLIKMLQKMNFRICGVFIMDSQFMIDGSKFLSGTMAALSVMVNLEIPHVNILSKMDLISKTSKKQLDEYFEPDPYSLLSNMESDPWNKKHHKLTEAIGKLIEDYSLVRFIPLNIKDDESVADIKLTINNIIQYGEDEDVKIRDFDEPNNGDDADDTHNS